MTALSRDALRYASACAAILTAIACTGDSPAPDAGSPNDAGPRIDGGPTDAGPDGGRTALDGGGPRDGGSFRPPDPVPVPALPPPASVPMDDRPTDEDGHPILTSSGPMQLVFVADTPPDAVHALARCSQLVLLCEAAGYDTDACLFSAPRCTTTRPWEEPACCPDACWSAYAAARATGESPEGAFDRALFGRPSCIDGLDAARTAGGAP